MPVRRATIRLAKELRLEVDSRMDVATRDIVQAWVRAWDQIEGQWQFAINDLLSVGEGQWPSRAQMFRTATAMRALAIATQQIQQLGDLTGVTVEATVREITADLGLWQARMIASQMPAQAGEFADLVAMFNRVDASAMAAIVERSTEEVTSLTRPLSAAARESMLQALVRGVAIGVNPRTTASRMLHTIEGEFNGGLSRALTIARTETLDAYRSGTAAAQFDNTDVLSGWVWQATLDTRTCPSCWVKHGTFYTLDELGPLDHQNGRCARLPKTKTWAQLGFAVKEPPDLFPDAQTTFYNLPERDQLKVMGAKRLEALLAGRVTWPELTRLRRTTGWRDSWVPARVGDLGQTSRAG